MGADSRVLIEALSGLLVAPLGLAGWLSGRLPPRRPARQTAARPLRLLVVLARPLASCDDLSSSRHPVSEALPARETRWVPLPPLHEALSYEVLEQALSAEHASLVVRYLRPPTLAALQEALLERYDAMVFDGYCLEDGSLAFEGCYGEQHAVGAAEIGRYLHDAGVHFAWLHSCYSAQTARGLQHAGVIATGGVAGTIDEEAGAAAVAACLAALGRGRNVRQALVEARRVLATHTGQAKDGAKLQISVRRWPAPRLVRPDAIAEYRGEASPLPGAAPPPVALIGREVEIALINRQLAQRRLVTLVGPPGIGKTTLARALARWQWERGLAPAGVCFIPLQELSSGASLLDELLYSLLPEYRPPAGLDGERLFRHKVSRLCARLGEGGWLLVLDDFTAVRDADAARLLQKLLQRCPGLHLLLTADERTGVAEEVAFPVEPLSQEQAVELFCQHSGQPYSESEWMQMADVCEVLARAPLAITLVARCPPQHPAEVLEELRRIRLRPPENCSEPLAQGATDGDPQSQGGLRLALEYSYGRLSVPAQRLFCSLALFHGGATTEALRDVLRSNPDHGQTLDELLQRNMIERDPAGGAWRYRLLPAVASHASHCFRQEADKLGLDRPLLRRSFAEYFLKAARQTGNVVAPIEASQESNLAQPAEVIAEKAPPQPAVLDTLDSERANLLAAVEEAYQTRAWQVAWRLARRTARLLSLRSYWMGGERTYLLARDAARRRGDAREEREMLNRVGDLYRRQGRWAEAKACFEQDLVICYELNDPRAEGETRVNLGTIHAEQGCWAEAMACYEQGLLNLRQAGDRQGEGRTLNLLSSIHRRQGRWSEAISMHQQALGAFREAHDRQGEAETLNHLGNIYRCQSRWAEAIRAHEESLHTYRDLQNRHCEGRALEDLGCVYQLQGHWVEAIACYEQVLAICQQLDDSYGEGQALTRLGLAYARQGQWAAAISTHQDALRIFRDLEDRQEEGKVLATLAEVYRLQGQSAEATAACQQALHLLRETKDLRREGQTLARLGLVYAHERHWDEAIAADQAALHIFRHLEDRHGEAKVLARLGLVYVRQARWAEAVPILQQGLDIFRQLGDLGSEVKVLNNLGLAYAWQGRWAQAVSCYEQVLAVRRAFQDRPAENRVLSRLGSIHRLRRHWKKAATCYGQSLTICRELQDHPGEAKGLANLAGVHDRHGRWVEAAPLYQESLKVFQEIQRRHAEAKVLVRLGLVYARQARWAEAGPVLQGGLDMLRRLGDRYGEGKLFNYLGLVHLDQGHWNKALALQHQSLEIFRSLGRRRSEARVLNDLGVIHHLQGRWAEAIACYEQDLTIRRRLGDRPGEGRALSNLGSIHQREGRWAEAIACHEQALAICRQIGDRQGEAKVLTALAGVHADQGAWSEATAMYQGSLAVFREVWDRYGEAQALTALGFVHVRQGEEGSAIASWYQALAIYEQLQAPEADQLRGWLKKYLAEGRPEANLEALQAPLATDEDESEDDLLA